MVTRWATPGWRVAVTALIGFGGCTSAVERPGHDVWGQRLAPPANTPQVDVGADSTAASLDLSTLAGLQDLAERRNPGLRAAYDRWTAAREQLPRARALPDPRFSYGWFVESVETRVGPQRQRFGISQTIPLFGKLGDRGDVAIHDANIAAAEFEKQRLALRLRITTLWNDYYYLGRSIATTEENVRLMTHLESAALSQYAAGRTSHAAAMRAQVELGRLEDRLRTLRDQRLPLVAALNAELDRVATAPIPWPDSLDVQPLQRTSEDLQRHLLQHNPELGALQARAARDSAAADLAGKGAIPDLTIGAEYIDTGPARDPTMPDSGKDAAIATASINLPLWFGQYRAESAQAQARRSATAFDLRQHRNRLLADLEREHFEYRDTERRIELYALTLLPRARQAFEVTEDAFTAGEASFLDLIDAQRTLLEFDLAYERALADRSIRLARLEALVGVELNRDAQEGSAP